MNRKDQLKRAVNNQASSTKDDDVKIVLTTRETILTGLGGDETSERPHVSLRYYWPKHQCFSDWGVDELKSFSEFCRKLTSMKWSDIYKTGGKKGHKAGLGYTIHKDHSVLPENPDLKKLSPDLTWFELRITQEARVHGFRVRDAFYLVFLDRDHAVYK